jgi:hypothetical protein
MARATRRAKWAIYLSFIRYRIVFLKSDSIMMAVVYIKCEQCTVVPAPAPLATWKGDMNASLTGIASNDNS